MGRAIEVEVEAPEEAREGLEGLLYLEGADSLAVEDEGTLPGEGRPQVPRGRVRLLAYFPEDPGEALAEKAKAQAGDVSVAKREIDPDLYRDRWKAYFKPAKVSGRLWVRPSWEPLPAPLGEGEVALEIDPGAAFGTGLHETTRLCLEEIDRVAHPGLSVLDVGTGSGILAIAAGLLGAGPILATDNDPLAVAAARENAEKNKLTNVRVEDWPIEEVPGSFDLVLANILAVTLLTLREPLVARVAPGGALVLSGLLAPELDYVRGAFLATDEGLSFEREGRLGEWGSLCLRRAA